MQGNFARWTWKLCCAMVATGLMGAGLAEAGSWYSSKSRCAPPPPKPVCEPKQPEYVPEQPVCEPPKPVCEWDVKCLRSKLQQIGKAVVCFQRKAACSRPDRNIIKAGIKFVTALVKCGTVRSKCNQDYEQAIACVESSLCELESVVRCSKNSDLICLIKEIRCLVKELSCCKQGCDSEPAPA